MATLLAFLESTASPLIQWLVLNTDSMCASAIAISAVYYSCVSYRWTPLLITGTRIVCDLFCNRATQLLLGFIYTWRSSFSSHCNNYEVADGNSIGAKTKAKKPKRRKAVTRQPRCDIVATCGDEGSIGNSQVLDDGDDFCVPPEAVTNLDVPEDVCNNDTEAGTWHQSKSARKRENRLARCEAQRACAAADIAAALTLEEFLAAVIPSEQKYVHTSIELLRKHAAVEQSVNQYG